MVTPQVKKKIKVNNEKRVGVFIGSKTLTTVETCLVACKHDYSCCVACFFICKM